MISRNNGRKPGTDGPKKGQLAKRFRRRVTRQLQHRTAVLGILRRLGAVGPQ
jgi:hypothetical protein